MMAWKKSVGESRVDCFRVMMLDRRRHIDQKNGVGVGGGGGAGLKIKNFIL